MNDSILALIVHALILISSNAGINNTNEYLTQEIWARKDFNGQLVNDKTVGRVVLFREVDGRVFPGHEKTEIVCITLYLDDARTNVVRHTFFFTQEIRRDGLGKLTDGRNDCEQAQFVRIHQ